MKKLILSCILLSGVTVQAIETTHTVVSVSTDSVIDSVKKYITDNPETTAKCIVAGAAVVTMYLGYKCIKYLCSKPKQSLVKPISVNHHITIEHTFEDVTPTTNAHYCSNGVCYIKPKPHQPTQVVHPTTVYVEQKTDTCTTAALMITEAERQLAERKAYTAKLQAEQAQQQAKVLAQQKAAALEAQKRAEAQVAEMQRQEKERQVQAEQRRLEAERCEREAVEAAQRAQEKADAAQAAEEDAADRGVVSFIL